MDFKYVKGDSLIIKGYALLCVDIRRLVSFLQSNTCIKKLFLVDLRVNAEEAKVLANINLTNLTSLHLKVDRILKYTYDLTVVERNLIVKVLGEALKSSEHPNLTSLHLEVVDVDDSGVRDLSKALESGSLPNLTSLHLKVGNIVNSGVRDLSKALEGGSLPNLTSLHLEVASIGNFDAQALSKALKSGKLPDLASLHLEGSKIGNKGAKALSEALKSGSLPNLTSLHLEGDEIGDSSVEDLSETLKSGGLPNLTSLHLKGGKISDFGTEALSKLSNFDCKWSKGQVTMLRRCTLKRKSSSEPEVSTASSKQYFKKFKSNEASQQQGAQTQFDQQQKPNAQAASAHSGLRWGKLATMLKRGIFKRKPCLELKVSTTEPEVSTTSSTKSLIPHPKKFKSDEANNQASQQQGAQTQFDQQQKPNAQAASAHSGLRWGKLATMLKRGIFKRKPCLELKVSTTELEVSTTSSTKSLIPHPKKFKSDEANNQASQQQGAQTQFDQQQKPNAQAASAHSGLRWGKLATMLKRGIFKRKPCLELKVSTTEPEVSTTSSTKSLIPHPKKFKSDEANNQASQQQGAQTQFDQQQKPNAQAANDLNVPPMSRSRSSNLSSPGGSNNDQPGPSSELDEVPLISRSQSPDFFDSLDPLRSDNNDQPASKLDEVMLISRSQSPDFFDSLDSLHSDR